MSFPDPSASSIPSMVSGLGAVVLRRGRFNRVWFPPSDFLFTPPVDVPAFRDSALVFLGPSDSVFLGPRPPREKEHFLRRERHRSQAFPVTPVQRASACTQLEHSKGRKTVVP
jgi:hypothetical protein